MTYGTNNHNVFSQRMADWFGSLQNLRDEADRLNEIYTNEATSGAHAAFVTNSFASKQEHIDGMTCMLALKDFVENGVVPQLDRTGNITAFTQ